MSPEPKRFPNPMIDMSPAGLPGLGAVALMFLGMWQLFGPYFAFGFALMSVVAVVAALVIRSVRAKRPAAKDFAHLDLGSEDEKASNE